ncbi:MAG: ABC transporter substrate-binding protein [Gammaproteobacteria bacterium]|nr:ABC transporter substrate-binding protein [Gammaproteobacteria bacterium]
MTTRRTLLGALGITLLVPPVITAQDRPDLPRVVVLSISAPADQMLAFEESLESLGHINGTTVSIQHHSTQGHKEKLDAFAEQAVELNPNVIVAIGSKAARAAKRATEDIPIVAVTGDMSASGLVKNLAHPEGNVTGQSLFQVDLMPKRLELLLELAPQIRRLNVFASAPINPVVHKVLAELAIYAQRKGIEVNVVGIGSLEELMSKLTTLRYSDEEGLLIRASPVFDAHSVEIGQLTAEYRLIAMLPWKEYVHAGGLISYSPDIVAAWRRAGTYVDRILRGAHPGDLPVEHPTQYELVINIGTVEKLGLTVPSSLLLRANEVVE